jgi:hypothetical protein
MMRRGKKKRAENREQRKEKREKRFEHRERGGKVDNRKNRGRFEESCGCNRMDLRLQDRLEWI